MLTRALMCCIKDKHSLTIRIDAFMLFLAVTEERQYVHPASSLAHWFIVLAPRIPMYFVLYRLAL